MEFKEAEESYQNWLKERLTLVPEELKRREQKLRGATRFEFLRATFFRWVQWWRTECEDLDQRVPRVLGVGDLHAENFGTWRDGEGRLVWGVNDFDECCILPYTHDLVRLAASAWFAIEERASREEKNAKDQPKKKSHQPASVEERFEAACEAILCGYCTALGIPFELEKEQDLKAFQGRKPFVLADEHDWLREVVLNKLREKTKQGEDKIGKDADDDFDKFLKEMGKMLDESPIQEIPHSAWDALRASMPPTDLPITLGRREAGLGSLGRQRFTAVVKDWCGGILVREAKALAPSAWHWDQAGPDADILYAQALRSAVRAEDPWISVHLGPLRHNWVVRRLAPDSGKVKLKDLPAQGALDFNFWCAMGREVANVHTPEAVVVGSFHCKQGEVEERIQDAFRDVRKDLEQRNEQRNWLSEAARKMAQRTVKDWKDYCQPPEA